MTAAGKNPYTRTVTTMALVLLAAVSVEAVGNRMAANSDARFQEVADRAALAGVSSLAATDGQPEHARIAAARQAAESVVSSTGSFDAHTSAEPSEMTVSVSLTSKRGTALQATARYIAPGETLSPDRRAERTGARRS